MYPLGSFAAVSSSAFQRLYALENGILEQNMNSALGV